jgi:hypothetical protein
VIDVKVTLVFENGHKDVVSVTIDGHRSYVEEAVPAIRETFMSTMNKEMPQHHSRVFKEK